MPSEGCVQQGIFAETQLPPFCIDAIGHHFPLYSWQSVLVIGHWTVVGVGTGVGSGVGAGVGSGFGVGVMVLVFLGHS